MKLVLLLGDQMIEWVLVVCIVILFIMNVTLFKLLNNQGEMLYFLRDEVYKVTQIFDRESSQCFSMDLSDEQAKELMKALGVEDD